MAVVCDACGSNVDYGARFCGSCGAAVAARTKEWVAEGRGKGKPQVPKPRAVKRREEVRSTLRGAAAGGTTPEATSPAPEQARAASTEGASNTSVSRDDSSRDEARTGPKVDDGPPVDGSAADVQPGPSDTIRPPSPGVGEEESLVTDESSRSEFQRLLDEVETGFDAILVTSEPTPGQETNKATFDEAQAKKLFDDLVVANAQSIRDLMIEVRLGEPHAAWVDTCKPAMRAILRSAQGMGFTELVGKAQRFLDALEAASAPPRQSAEAEGGREPAPCVRGEARERLIDGYSELIAFFPEAFALEQESNLREGLIVRSILGKVDGLRRLALDRIYDTGMASLGLFYVTRSKDLSELADLPLDLAERVIDAFKAYRLWVSTISPERGRLVERARLAELTDELGALVTAYESASTERRTLRRRRAAVSADIQLVLARLGQVARAHELEKQAFAARVQALRTYLDEAERTALAELSAR
jgi:arsenate reductase-like glutaredoxin family protein